MSADEGSVSEQLAEDIQTYLVFDGIYLDITVTRTLAECLLLDEEWVIRRAE